MERKYTLRDANQIVSAEHYEELDAKRVYIVNGEMPTINIPEIKFPELKLPEMQKIEVPVIIKEIQIERIEVPIVVKEIEIKEIQNQVVVVDKQLQIERVEIPVVQKEIEVIEKPVIITQYRDLPKWVGIALMVQVLTSLLMLFKR